MFFSLDAISIVAKSNDDEINLSKNVYPIISKKHSKSVYSVIKAIEIAIIKLGALLTKKHKMRII